MGRKHTVPALAAAGATRGARMQYVGAQEKQPRAFREGWRGLIKRDARYSRLLTLGSGEIVYTNGHLDDAVYLVERGLVKVSFITRSGKSCVLGICGPAEVFGETCLAGAGRLGETAITLKTTVLKKMSAVRFRARLQEEGLFEDFAEHLVKRVLDYQTVIAELTTLSSEYRLAAMLVRLSQKSAEHDSYDLQIKERISCQDLSEMVGTTRSRIGYFIKKFREEGLITSKPGCFLCINEAALARYTETACVKDASFNRDKKCLPDQPAQS